MQDSVQLPPPTTEDIPSPPVLPQSGQEAWARLQEGNARFAQGQLDGFLKHLALEVSPEIRQKLVSGQDPYAIIVTCADSRVAPELIFDEGLGYLFVIRIAGNVIDDIAVGSIEYAALHLKPKLIVILGHQSCGAVTAALQAHSSNAEEGHIGAIVSKIKHAVQKAHDAGLTDETQILDRAICENALDATEATLERSHALTAKINDQSMSIVCAVYKLDTGVVEEIPGRYGSEAEGYKYHPQHGHHKKHHHHHHHKGHSGN
jgi:carbonic anhydrase